MSVTEEVDKLDPVVEAEKLKQEFEDLGSPSINLT